MVRFSLNRLKENLLMFPFLLHFFVCLKRMLYLCAELINS